MNIGEYLDEVRSIYATGKATEHSYRGVLLKLFQSIDPTITAINEPKQSEGGMPDFLFQRGDVPLGWCEAKDVDKDVIKLKGYSKEQRKRYEAAYPNLIYTNCVDFEFIVEGEQVHYVSIADFLMGLQPVPERFDELERQLRRFVEQKPISIRSASKLAKIMAAKAAIMKDEIGLALKEDPQFRTGLGIQFKSFKANLLPALEPDEFADLYAETITYGMFAARFHDHELDTFSRQEAMEDLPASNPFLKGLFSYIAGPSLPKRLEYIVDDLVHVMRASDPHSLFKDYGKWDARNDPFIHFYEDFLKEYNPAKRKSRGVYYTPEPVVNFIVRAVDDVLKTEFGLADGLADTSKVTVDWDTGTNHPRTGKPITEKREVHRVQVLDPATGTGTFLAEVVRTISDRVKTRAPGQWSSYVERDLLPRLHGFELLMASYAMCHMKLDMMLDQTGYKPSATPPRLSVWLTNALEPADREVRDLFMPEMVEEARGASEVKRQTPIMCVIGNPPYSGLSQNMGKFITDLIEDYKYVDGEHFGERKHWLHDDYVKFIRMSEALIAENPSGGVLGFITNHGYIGNPTFRGMRWHLLETFDKIWILDLHGNSKKKEVCPDGSPDKNVFDIMQGVAIVVAVRNGKGSKELAEVRHGDLWGNRNVKYQALWSQDRHELTSQLEAPRKRYFMFYPVDAALLDIYDSGFALNEMFLAGSSAFVTGRDEVNISFSSDEAREKLNFIANAGEAEIRQRFGPNFKDSRDWTVATAKADAIENGKAAGITKCTYRAFDTRFTCYTGRSRGLYSSPQPDSFNGAGQKAYLALATARINSGSGGGYFLAVNQICDFHLCSDSTSNFTLYRYPSQLSDQADAFAPRQTIHNLDPKLYAAICETAGIDPANTAMQQGLVESEISNASSTPENAGENFLSVVGDARPSEVKIFDYVYGVLHSPKYRSTYAEFLKIDFPRVPYPVSPEVFSHVSEKGEQLRRLHLMETAAIGDTPYVFHGDGDSEVASGYPKFESGKIFINPDQYFDTVPQLAWTFHIGGYQPAQKWLKDRRGRQLSWDDIGHYQKIVKILVETDRIMKEIKLPLE